MKINIKARNVATVERERERESKSYIKKCAYALYLDILLKQHMAYSMSFSCFLSKIGQKIKKINIKKIGYVINIQKICA